jgi:hypothetical protein
MGVIRDLRKQPANSLNTTPTLPLHFGKPSVLTPKLTARSFTPIDKSTRQASGCFRLCLSVLLDPDSSRAIPPFALPLR